LSTATYLDHVNFVLSTLGWNEVTSGGFANPSSPAKDIKRLLNQSKNEVLAEIGQQYFEQDGAFTTLAPATTPQNYRFDGTFGAQTLIADAGITNVYGKLILPEGNGDSWYRAQNNSFGQALNLDRPPRVNFTSQALTMLQDEYSLGDDFHQLISAWTDEGPLKIKNVSPNHDIDEFYPGDLDQGTPLEIAVFRGFNFLSTSFITYWGPYGGWWARIRPIPDGVYTIYYTARRTFPDLSAYDDTWSLPEDIEWFIRDRTMFKVLSSPLQSDPDLAITIRADLAARLETYKDTLTPVNPGRRMRREGPDESRHDRRRRRDFPVS
jgi:hypothetical protein